MVRFFGKTRATPRKDTRRKTADDAPPGPPASRTSAAATKAAAATGTPARTSEKKTATTRTKRAPARPPRIDWAAEAAAAPMHAPAPAPSSLATAPSGENGAQPGAPLKRRRGTRGGRGRKKTAGVETAPATAAPAPAAPPASIEEALAQQSVALDQLSRDVGATLRTLQTTVDQLQRQAGQAVTTTHPRVGIFVDVPNLIYAAERRNINLDFGRVLEYFTRGRDLVRASAYAPISDDPQAKLENQRFVHHFVGHPYRIITKPLKRFADGSMKANFDIELAIDILTMSDRLDVVVLMSGDGDFTRLVELVASRGVRVEVVAFGEAVSSELKSVADLYIDLGQRLEEFRSK